MGAEAPHLARVSACPRCMISGDDDDNDNDDSDNDDDDDNDNDNDNDNFLSLTDSRKGALSLICKQLKK